MPKYIVTCEGSLEVGRQDFPTGSVVSLSKEKANSLPPGTVELAPVDPEGATPEVSSDEPEVELAPVDPEGATPEVSSDELESHSKKKRNRR